ncbi:ABC transporter permease subunit [Rhodococcus aerolatus]
MTTSPTAPVTEHRGVTGHGTGPGYRVTQLGVLRAELTKLRSLRSTVWSLLAAALLVIGLSVLVPLVAVSHWPPRNPAEAAGFDPTARSLAGMFLAQLAIGVLGVLLVTGEYATGSIRSTFAAVPARLPVLWAKRAVFAAATLVVMVPAVLVAFFVGQTILSGKGIQASIGDPGVLRAVIGATLYLTVVGVLGIGLGTLLRSTAAGISALFGLLFVLPIIVRLLPSSVSDPVGKYLPSSAGQAITAVVPESTSLSPWVGFVLFCGYAALAVGAAAVMLLRRDA